MALSVTYLSEVALGELLDQMVTRREKVFRSVEAVGRSVAEGSYSDVVLVIEAINSVLADLDS